MFCPNCGAQNADEVVSCQKCGFKIKETAAPLNKFKGTMLMMNAPAGIQQMQQPAPAAPPAAVPPGGAVPATAPMAANLAANPGPSVSAKPNFKGTMMGVAPPSMAGLMAGAGANPNPVNVSHAPSTTPASPGALQALTAPPGSPVNPLGGTLIAASPAQPVVISQAPAAAPVAAALHTGTTGTQPSPVYQASPVYQGQAGAFGSTMPSNQGPSNQAAPNSMEFGSTTPSAGVAPPNFAAAAAQYANAGATAPQPMIAPTQSIPQVSKRPGVLSVLVVILLALLAALAWTLLK